MSGSGAPEGMRIGLADAIAGLRAELSRARQEGEGKDIRFAVDKIEVEIAVDFGWTREANGGLKLFSFVDVGGKAGDSGTTSHKIKLMLQVDQTGSPTGPMLIGDNDGPGAVGQGG